MFQDCWKRLWQSLAVAEPDPAPLLARYSEPHRHYHTVQHIDACLAELAGFPEQDGIGPAMKLAIFYHDAVYDPRAADNERQSAVLARRELGSVLPELIIEQIGRLIMSTDHRAEPRKEDEPLIVDVDLAILGQPAKIFDAYEGAIRREYGHVADADFCAGRSRILRQFLERRRLYHTDYFFQRYEEAARRNVERSIETLLKGGRAGLPAG